MAAAVSTACRLLVRTATSPIRLSRGRSPACWPRPDLVFPYRVTLSRAPASAHSRRSVLPDHFPVALPKGISIKKTRHLTPGVDISFEIAAQPGSAALAALVANTQFPAGRVELDSTSVTVAGERTIPFTSSKGTVTFGGKADA